MSIVGLPLSQPSPASATLRVTTGRCHFIIPVRKCQVVCPCEIGIFEIPVGSPNGVPECLECGHGPSHHVRAKPPQNVEVEDAALRGGTANGTDRDTFDILLRNLFLVPRHDTVKKMWQRLREVRLIHCHGTPASGKTTIAALLGLHIKAHHPELDVVLFSWKGAHWGGELGPGTGWRLLLRKILQLEGYAVKDICSPSLVLLIDEAQNSYPYEGFWTDYLKGINGKQNLPMVALFSSYGCGGAVPTRFPGSVPLHLTSAQMMSMQPTKATDFGLDLTVEEFAEAVRRQEQARDEGLFRLGPGVADYIYEFTAGHAGCASSILQILRTDGVLVQRMRGAETQLTLEVVETILENDEWLFEKLTTTGCMKSLPYAIGHVEDAKEWEVLKRALDAPFFVENILQNPALNSVYQQGLLHAKTVYKQGRLHAKGIATAYFFPSPIHHRLFKYKLYKESISNGEIVWIGG
ncbi:hypothetical protein EJ06DRAFT_272097 [Trichodelitschia bisporula]|uniref:Uncharacterized protein n=1 Tax=Trichodelitschia bisporula TaxID=703511 RepID=A0A6G1I4S8_9PEZI|nr:hypothetical protein EJ06DRAFT_272097 [Trichodelitschia bisporula]